MPVKFSFKTQVPRLRIILYLEWVVISVLAIVFLSLFHTQRDLVWVGLTLLLGIQLIAMSRHLPQFNQLANQSIQEEPPNSTLLRQSEQEKALDHLLWHHSLAYNRYDELGQFLAALNIQLETAVKLWQADPDRAYSFLVIAHQQGITAMQEVRKAISIFQMDVFQVHADAGSANPYASTEESIDPPKTV